MIICFAKGSEMKTQWLLVVLAAWLLMPGRVIAASPIENGERPRFELRAGENYFRIDNQPAFVLGRNPVGTSPQAYADHFRHAAVAGERLMRIHFTFSPPAEEAGQIDTGVLEAWDAVLDAAEKDSLAVLPVLGVWADWNDGSRKEIWHTWHKNAFNRERGGPAERPDELFEDTPCRRLWLKRLETLVTHWRNRRAVVGWEIFSELDLVTGASQDRAVEFTELAAGLIRATDPWKRPITASQAGINEWPKLLSSDSLDFIQVHPYAGGRFTGRLDDLIISVVGERLRKYGKPVLLGECGLDAAPPRGTLDVAARAEVGIRNAIWASVVSGAMNGRMLWWQDGYDQFENADLNRHYQQAAAPVAAFVDGIDFTDFAPVTCDLPPGLKGAALGNAKVRLAWFRDAGCYPPDWPMQPLPGQSVTIDAPAGSWRIEFFDTVTGKFMGQSHIAVREQRLRIALTEFQGSIAVKMNRMDP
jgi:hypothetical protein